MEGFLFETHMHTAEGSGCARNPAREQVRFYKKLGFDGVIITEHLTPTEEVISDAKQWKQRAERCSESWKIAKDEGDRVGLQVFYGWEYGFHGNDFLTYGLSWEWLAEHPEMDAVMRAGINEYCDLVHENGGFVVHAHPFREAGYIDMIRLVPRKVDAVEILNANRKDFENLLARQYAENYALPMVGGSDNHYGVQKRYCAVKAQKRFASVQDYIDSVKAGTLEIVEIPGE